jgi:cytochrome c biogenesis protein ResB
MRKIFLTMILLGITISCTCNEEVVTLALTEQEKTIVPYVLNDAVKWINNNNTTFNGTVNEIKEKFDEGGRGCDVVLYNYLFHYLQFEDFKYEVKLYKMSANSVHLVIQEYYENEITKAFKRGIKLEDFTTIQFNGETYENAVLIKESVSGNKPFGHLVYSKTNGIEFILFDDGTWYKRVE